MPEEIKEKNLINRPFERIFRNNIARVIDFFIINEQFSFTKQEISEISNIPIRTVQRIIPKLIQSNILIENHPKSRYKTYELNKDSELVQILTIYSIATINSHIENAKNKRNDAILSLYNKR